MSAPAPSSIVRKRRRRRRRNPPIFPILALLLLTSGAIAGGVWLFDHKPGITRSLPHAYVGDVETFRQEYTTYFGTPLIDQSLTLVFKTAAEAAARGNVAGAGSVLESAVKTGGVPVLFHDLGVAYTTLGDAFRASEAFREVMVRDPGYTPTRNFLATAKLPPGAVDLPAHELEPNNDPERANLIGLRSPVAGELAGYKDSADFFRSVAPGSPRDLVLIELKNQSIRLAPKIRVYDSNQRPLGWADAGGKPGESLTLKGGLAPNSRFYIGISATEGSGNYVLTVTPQRAFDSYEPNDELSTARRIAADEEVTANVMDPEDNDYYSFVSPRKGMLTIELHNRSNTLIPLLTTYDADHRSIGFAGDVRKPGSDANFAIEVEKNATYFIEVSSQAGSSGAYSLRIK